ncbi:MULTISPECIES: peptide-methionine (R)-S-oxide reductase MsrB [unclassified Microcoleus]|uniref:peptide-methionine (R)-S-oxide reductase MsrB n=1 Tax=unclassified Microcoleus TaxID=2642155 RepID=UPI00312B436A
MKKRFFLQAGAATVSIAWLSRYWPGKSKVMAASKGVFEVTKTEEEWRKLLTPAQFDVLRKHGTERSHTSPLDKQYGSGIYECAGCSLPLFSSQTKFNSGTGWPSFYDPIKGAIATSVDNSLFASRIEVHCHRCGGHLGHVFDDGPAPTGKRYCMNGVAMKFIAG